MNAQARITEHVEQLLAGNDLDGLREVLVELLEQPGAAARLRALDDASLLTRIIPELEPARATDQPLVHFLPVLAHSLETVAAVEWLLDEIRRASGEVRSDPGGGRVPGVADRVAEGVDSGNSQLTIHNSQLSLPAAIQAHPELRYRSVYAPELGAHFAGSVGRYPRAALYKLGALLHDVAKPATKQPKPDGGVSFHDHQTIGGEVALDVARRLGFDTGEVAYIRSIVREHMRPGQLAALDELTLRAVNRFFQDIGDAGPDVLVFLLADHMATRGPLIDVAAWVWQARWVDDLLDTIWGEQEAVTPPLLNGHDLMRELGIGPGPLVGRLLAAVGEAQADQRITTRTEALELARRLLSQF